MILTYIFAHKLEITNASKNTWKILVKEIMTIQQKYVFIADYARNVAKCLKKQEMYHG